MMTYHYYYYCYYYYYHVLLPLPWPTLAFKWSRHTDPVTLALLMPEPANTELATRSIGTPMPCSRLMRSVSWQPDGYGKLSS